MPIEMRQPDQPVASGSTGIEFPIDDFMGKWQVAWSTLPLWKDKKDVFITYANLPSAAGATPGSIKFDDLVEYKKQSASANSKPSTVKGIDTLDLTAPNPLTYDWRGKGMLTLITSRWQVLGFGRIQESGGSTEATPSGGLEERGNGRIDWAVTFFSKTLFTPAGIDIYLRPELSTHPSGISSLKTIEVALIGLGGDVAELAKGGFVVGQIAS